jgi:glutathione synthase/RimK-type ligase-like ATP-grasp enzyme
MSKAASKVTSQILPGTQTRAARIHVLHENDEWVAPLRVAFEGQGAPFTEWFLDQGGLDLRAEPPPGVFYNRMSASSHTRGHRYAPEYTAGVLAWLERHGRRVVNGSRALQLEVSKVAQYQALAAFGVPVPDTLAVVGRGQIMEAAQSLGFPLILKHNRAGKGLGVQLFQDADALAAYIGSDGFEEPLDGITLVQRYIAAPEPYITRLEFVGGRFLYAVRVDTSAGFELCPADVCALPEEGAAAPLPAVDKFRIDPEFDTPLIPLLEKVIAANDIEIAGIEVIRDAQGQLYAYDINTNTNYNPDAEAKAGIYGMRAIAGYLNGLLR